MRRLLTAVAAIVMAAAACAPASAPTSPAATPLAAAPIAEPRATDPAPAPDAAPMTGRAELRQFASASLGRAMPYWVYVPAGYDKGTRAYAVLYMLHGMGGSHDEWRGFGLFDAADRLIGSREIAPMIIVLPQGDRSYWMDHADGSGAWGSYTAKDLVREIDQRYRTVAGPTGRAIGGVSMGAHGAIQLALNHPNTFAVVGAHSIALRRPAQAPVFFGGATDFAARDPMTLVRTRTDAARSLLLWLDIGDQDPWTSRARQLRGELDQLRIAYEWREWPGDHSASYWSEHVADYLRFYDSALARCAAGTDLLTIAR